MIPKFRAWDIENDEMLFPDDTDKVSFVIEADGIGTYDMRYPGDEYAGWAYLDTILMQSTGLKDKNGVEIFEGDIVKIIGDVLGDDMSVIRFTEGGFYLDYKNLDTEFELLYSIDLPIEIIGNIYENPELLEVEG